MYKDLESILASLISIPSVNPMGRTVNPELDFEARMTDFLERYFRELGVPFLRQPIAPGRDNIVAWLPAGKADSGAPIMLWEVHQDTVPVDGMTIPPFEPAVRNGRMYGRGACDVKGSMAAMLHALGRLANERPVNAASIILACAVDEEAGGSGARGLMTRWPELTASDGLPAMPAMSIVAEPTELNVVVAHKGVVRWRCRTIGRAVHSSSPENGDNAIYRMGRVVAALERYHREELRGREPHRLLGTPSLSVGLISGGA
ncbi:MAG: M20/M25/M40 family metallo-hydrolase, partial [Planctomycetales bacterium]|nr:M20/M25/M40 family metallo-hydrolase [Planctomycetales bacterium]